MTYDQENEMLKRDNEDLKQKNKDLSKECEELLLTIERIANERGMQPDILEEYKKLAQKERELELKEREIQEMQVLGFAWDVVCLAKELSLGMGVDICVISALNKLRISSEKIEAFKQSVERINKN